MAPVTPPWEALRTTAAPDEEPATIPPEAATPPEKEPRTTALAAEAPAATAPDEEPDAAPPPGQQPRTTAPAAETPATPPPDEEPDAAPPAGQQPRTTTAAAEAPASAPAAEMPAAPPVETSRVAVPTPRLRPREARLPIFESVESDWFRARRVAPAHAGATVDQHGAERSWISPGDEGWRAAETVLAPTVGGITASGLPRRPPRANLVPGSAGARKDRPARAADSADAVSNRLAGFQRGSRRARAAPGAQSSDEQE
jgi:hypothetical protein